MREEFTTAPAGWESAAGKYEFAIERTLQALRHPDVVTRFSSYYARGGNYAGATFLEVGPFDSHSLTAGDLLALTLLDVQAPPLAVRRILEPSRIGDRLTALLDEQHLPVDADLSVADEGTLLSMAVFHETVKEALAEAGVERSNRWVTASKLCARKRPDLFPVRDSVVCDYLGLRKPKHNNEVDWQVFRRVIQHDAVRGELDQVVDRASRGVDIYFGSPNRRLRHLDVVLWMHASKLRRA